MYIVYVLLTILILKATCTRSPTHENIIMFQLNLVIILVDQTSHFIKRVRTLKSMFLLYYVFGTELDLTSMNELSP